MLIIPAVDIQQGKVVHACGGARSRYLPIRSQLCQSSDPEEIIAALLRHHPYPIIYIADLNAIQKNGDNQLQLVALSRIFPDTEFWLDSGFTCLTEAVEHPENMQIVLGSESLASCTALRDLTAVEADYILSLDFKGGAFLGDPEILSSPSLWPRRVIILDLAAVGGTEGNALETLQRVQDIAQTIPNVWLYAAGGVRDQQDVALLAQLGFRGALVASAIHNGTL